MNNILDLMNTKSSKVDFILCIGNDDNDESMFEAIKNYSQKNIECSYYTVTVGQKYSKADFFVHDSIELLGLLEGLAKLNYKSRSLGDLFGNSYNSFSNNKKCASELFSNMKGITEVKFEEDDDDGVVNKNDSDDEDGEEEDDDTLCLI